MLSFYPQVTSGPIMALTTIKQQLDLDGGYLDRDDCPYENDMKDDLKALLATKVVEVPVEVEKIVHVEKRVEVAAEASQGAGKRGPKLKNGGVQNAEVIGKELTETLTDLRTLKVNAKTLQPKDKLDIMKVQAMMLEKLITMEERNTNLKRMNLFMSTIMGILDDLVPADQHQAFMKRLQPFAEAE